MKRTIYLTTMLLGVFSFSLNAIAEIKLSNSLAKDIGKSYGFYLGQNYSLKKISTKYSSLSGLALIAEKEFSANFKSSIEGMDAIMVKYAKNEWNKIKNKLPQQIAGSININQITEAQARQFIELVRQRAKGNIKW